jgi:hypothetical protein
MEALLRLELRRSFDTEAVNAAERAEVKLFRVQRAVPQFT